MLIDMLPLLSFVTLVVIARNVFEAHVLDNERRRLELRELVRVRAQGSRAASDNDR